MAGLVKKFLASASVVAGMSAVFGAPAMAAPEIDEVNVYGPSVIYTDDGTGDLDPVPDPSSLSNEDRVYILQDANNGNIELNGTTDHSSAVEVDYFTDLEVWFDDGSNVVFSSIEKWDWLNNGLAEEWFTEAWNSTESGVQDFFTNQGLSFNEAYNSFKDEKLYDADPTISLMPGVQGLSFARRISDPNVASVSKDDDGNIFFQLAGHYQHGSGLALSEVVAVEVDGVFQGYFYSFGAPDELAEVHDDDISEMTPHGSHIGLRNFTVSPEDVPEPSTVLGLMAIGGLVAATKRKSQK